jgi:hypothetical protein
MILVHLIFIQAGACRRSVQVEAARHRVRARVRPDRLLGHALGIPGRPLDQPRQSSRSQVCNLFVVLNL